MTCPGSGQTLSCVCWEDLGATRCQISSSFLLHLPAQEAGACWLLTLQMGFWKASRAPAGLFLLWSEADSCCCSLQLWPAPLNKIPPCLVHEPGMSGQEFGPGQFLGISASPWWDVNGVEGDFQEFLSKAARLSGLSQSKNVCAGECRWLTPKGCLRLDVTLPGMILRRVRGTEYPITLTHTILFPSRPLEPWQCDPEQCRGAELLGGSLEHPRGTEGLLPGDTSRRRGRNSNQERLS